MPLDGCMKILWLEGENSDVSPNTRYIEYMNDLREHAFQILRTFMEY